MSFKLNESLDNLHNLATLHYSVHVYWHCKKGNTARGRLLILINLSALWKFRILILLKRASLLSDVLFCELANFYLDKICE